MCAAALGGLVDAIEICLTVPIEDGNEAPGYRLGATIGVVAYDTTVGAWMPDRRAMETLPAIANRAWYGRAAAIDGLRRILLAPEVRGLVAMRVPDGADACEVSAGYVHARLQRLARAAGRVRAGVGSQCGR